MDGSQKIFTAFYFYQLDFVYDGAAIMGAMNMIESYSFDQE